MPGKFPVGKPRMPSWLLPVLAVGMAVTTHAIWLVLPQPQVRTFPKPPEVVLYAYPNLDAQTWSPTLFSLPSVLGFSAAVRKHPGNVSPPLKSPLELIPMKPFSMEEYFPDPELRIPLTAGSRLPITALPPEPGSMRNRPVLAWQLKVLEGEGEGLELSRLPLPPSGSQPVSVTGVMTFDSMGQISSLTLDPAALNSAMRDQILRALRRVRRAGGRGASTIRFQFGYLPAERTP